MESLYERYLAAGGRVTTDSRAVKGGEIFFALKGENFDGNEYALKAIEAGAAWAVVDEGSEAAKSGSPRIIAVPDSFEALRELARTHRERCMAGGKRLPVIGLTGTNGKTTTKELIREVLSRRFRVTATEGNLNNDIGVPLSLLKIRPDTEIAVIEMGASHPDDIAHLTAVCEPDFGLITNVGRAHLLGFGSFEGVKRAKGQLYDWIAAHGGEVFLNADDPVLREMAGQRDGLKANEYGRDRWRTEILAPSREHPYLRLTVPEGLGADGKGRGRTLTCETHLAGAYNADNVLAAVAVGLRFGVPLSEALGAVAGYVPANNRSQMEFAGSNTLIIDAYNANPTSMKAALDNFDGFDASRKVVLLGMMGELGADSAAEHEALVRRLSVTPYERVCLVGEGFRAALDAVKAPSIKWFSTSDELASWLGDNPPEDSVVLVKGSRSQRMEKVLPVLRRS